MSPEQELAAPPRVIVESETYTHADAALTGEVLVSSYTWFYAHPDSEIRFRFRSGDLRPPGGDALRFSVLEDHGAWVELEAGEIDGEPSRPCVESDSVLHLRGLRVFVPREALMPTTTRAVTMSFDDGTSLRLRPGVPLSQVRPGDRWRLFYSDEAHFHAPVPAEFVGLSFSESGPPLDERTPSYHLKSEAELSFADGERLAMRDPSFHTVGDAIPQADGLTVLIELDTYCFHAKVLTRAADVSSSAVGRGGLGLIGTGSLTAYSVSEGATVYWADGSEAGRLRADFGSAKAPSERGELRCFWQIFRDMDMGPVTERRVQLCYRAADVHVAE